MRRRRLRSWAEAPFRISNDTDEPVRAWVATTLGMRAVMSSYEMEIRPPWLQ